MDLSNNNIGRMTVLEMTTNILEKMDSDEVNSIFDTVESRGVAAEIQDSFRHITSNSEDYQKEGYVQLSSLSNSDFFNQLAIPDNVIRIEELWYVDDCGERCVPLYEDPRQFVNRLFRLYDDCSKDVAAYGTKGPCFPVGTECDPQYYTSFDNKHIFFDSVDLRKKESIHSSKTGALALISPVFELRDDFIPPLRADEFPLLLNEAIDACFVNFKGVSNSKAQSRARMQKVMKQNNRERIGPKTNSSYGPPYGRRSRGGTVSNPYGNGD